MKIGDLFMRVLADDKGFAADLNKKAGTAGDQAGRTLGQRMSAGMKKGGSGLFAGLGLGAGIAAFGAVDTAISSTIRFLGDAVSAGIEEEKSIAKLTTAIRENVIGWDGNTAAMEKVLATRMALGFSDDEQRDSLAGLVAATHDVNKALDLQRVAMDLARFRNISLKEASEALTKVEGGQYKMLKTLGIQLPKNATATEALAAVQKVANGQAEAYANTTGGKLLVAQIKIGEQMERLGTAIMPLVADAAGAVADAIDDLAVTFDFLGGKIPDTEEGFEGLIKTLNSLNPMSWGTSKVMEDLKEKMAAAERAAWELEASTTPLGKGVQTAGDLIDQAGVLMAKAFGKVGTGAKTASTTVKTEMDDILTTIAATTSALESAASGAADALFDPIIAKAELARNEQEQKRQRNLRDSKTSNAQEKQDAIDKLTELNKAKLKLLADLAGYGDSASATALQAQINVLKTIKNITAGQIASLQALEAQLRRTLLAAAILNKTLPTGGGDLGYGRAGGGPVTAGHPYLVNENTPNSELWVPSVSGHVLGPSATPAVAPVAASGGGHTVNIYNPEPRAADADVGRALRRAAALGF